MKITDKQIDKLKQLDRIEYKLDKEKLDESYESSIALSLLIPCLVIIGFFMIIGIQIYIGVGVDVLSEIPKIVGFLVYLLVCAGFIDIVRGLVYTKKHDKLDKKYFKIKTK